jgi:hypothetical protein
VVFQNPFSNVRFAALLLGALATCPAAFGQAVTGSGVATQGAVWNSSSNLTNSQAVYYADTVAGTGDPCVKINAAMLSLPATGGIVDARGFQGKQPCSVNPFVVPTNIGTIVASTTSATVTNTNLTAWSSSQVGGALFCSSPAGVFLGIVQSVGSGSLTLTANAASNCGTIGTPSAYTISAKSGQLLLGNATYSISVPWIVPDRWRVTGSGRGTPSGVNQNGLSTVVLRRNRLRPTSDLNIALNIALNYRSLSANHLPYPLDLSQW